MDATASSVAASTGRGRGAAAGARGVAAGGAAGVAAITPGLCLLLDGFAPLSPLRVAPLFQAL